MYTIPVNFDLGCLKNKTVSEISFGQNVISLFFEDGFVSFEGYFNLLKKDKLESFYVCPVETDFGLLELLEKQIIHVDTNEERTDLLIKFENGHILTIVGTQNYE